MDYLPCTSSLVEISGISPPPHGVKTSPRVWGKPPATFSSLRRIPPQCLSTTVNHRRPNIRFQHGKYNPPRALVHGLCLLTVVAPCNGFRRISSDVQQRRAYVADPITSLFISILITWTLATQCPKNIEGEVCSEWWCVAGCIGVSGGVNSCVVHVGGWTSKIRKSNRSICYFHYYRTT